MGGNKIEPWLTGRYQVLQVQDLRNNKRVNRGQIPSVSEAETQTPESSRYHGMSRGDEGLAWAHTLCLVEMSLS
jgi:hypothetical protein